MCTDHLNSITTLPKTVYILSIHVFTFFLSDFVAIFASTTTFKKVHRPCKHYSNIVNNSLHHVYFFSLFFFLIFWLCFHSLPYLEMYTDHVHSNLSTTVYIMSILFFSFFLTLWLYFCIDYNIEKYAQTMISFLFFSSQNAKLALFGNL